MRGSEDDRTRGLEGGTVVDRVDGHASVSTRSIESDISTDRLGSFPASSSDELTFAEVEEERELD